MQPLHSTALGKVLSAYDPVAHSEALEADRKAYTDRTVCEPDRFEHILDITRARGYAADVEETWEGIAAIAAPIHDRRRMPVGAVGINGAVERLCRDGELRPELVAAVRDCACAVSRDLGAGRFLGTRARVVKPEAGTPKRVPAFGVPRQDTPRPKVDNPGRSITIVLSITELLTHARRRSETRVHRSALSNTYRQYALECDNAKGRHRSHTEGARTPGGTRGSASLDEGQRSRGCPAPTSSSARPSVPPYSSCSAAACVPP